MKKKSINSDRRRAVDFLLSVIGCTCKTCVRSVVDLMIAERARGRDEAVASYRAERKSDDA